MLIHVGRKITVCLTQFNEITQGALFPVEFNLFGLRNCFIKDLILLLYTQGFIMLTPRYSIMMISLSSHYQDGIDNKQIIPFAHSFRFQNTIRNIALRYGNKANPVALIIFAAPCTFKMNTSKSWNLKLQDDNDQFFVTRWYNFTNRIVPYFVGSILIS